MNVVPDGGASHEVLNMDLVVAAAWLQALGTLSSDPAPSTRLTAMSEALWPSDLRDDDLELVLREANRQARSHFRDVNAAPPS